MNADQDRRACSSILPETFGWKFKSITKKRTTKKKKKEIKII